MFMSLGVIDCVVTLPDFFRVDSACHFAIRRANAAKVFGRAAFAKASARQGQRMLHNTQD
jgi:hypothetical protein